MKKFFFFFFFLFVSSVYADVPVLMYYSVTDALPPGDTVISPEQFEEHLKMLHRDGYKTVTISQFVELLKTKTKISEKIVVLTLDDGGKDNLTAASLMKKYNIAGTFYVCSGMLHNKTYMNEEDIFLLSEEPLFEIGAHSHTHFIKEVEISNTTIDFRIVVGEILISKKLLEQITKKTINTVAWPYGYYTNDLIEYAKYIGFTSTSLVFSNENDTKDTQFKIERITISGNCTVEKLKNLLEHQNSRVCQ